MVAIAPRPSEPSDVDRGLARDGSQEDVEALERAAKPGDGVSLLPA